MLMTQRANKSLIVGRIKAPSHKPQARHNQKQNKKMKDITLKFKKWLEQCPVEYDEIQETGDKDILTINFHGKDIYWHTIGKE